MEEKNNEKKERKMRDSGIPWIGKVPEEWECTKGKFIFEYKQKPVRADDEVITCFRDGEVTLRRNRREDGFTLSDKEIGYQGIDAGDLVVHGMDGFAGAIGISDSRGKASPVLNVLDTLHSKKYMMYYLRGLAYKGVFVALATGIRVRSCDLRWNKLAELYYTVPPISEQHRIADFLDSKCSEIDALIENLRARMESAKEYKKAVITEAVTKGLNKDAKMKDSGVEWIGEISEKWKLVPFKYLLNERNEKNYPIKSDERLSLSIDKGITLYSEKTTNLDRFKDDVSQYKLAYCGDFVMNSMNMIVGAVGVSKYFGCVSPAYYVFFDDEPDNCYCKYCDYLFHTSTLKRILFSLGKGIMAIDRGNGNVNTCRLKVSRYDLGALKLPIPPREELQNILSYLDSKCSEIDVLLQNYENQIATLEEYKKSLIYEYVTGKKEVPTA